MIGGDMKLDECFQLGVCTITCPKGLDPKGAIQGIKDLWHEFNEEKQKKRFSVYTNENDIKF